jgi:hypothetical protein
MPRRKDFGPVFVVIYRGYAEAHLLSSGKTLLIRLPPIKTSAMTPECGKLHFHEILSALSTAKF